MPRTFKCDDTKLLGYGCAEEVYTGSSYTVIDAEAQAGLGSLTTRFIYLKSNCTRPVADEAIRKYHNANSHLLQPASGKIPHRLGEHQVSRLEELVWKQLVNRYFSKYLDVGLDGVVADEHFIEPVTANGSVMKGLDDYMTGRTEKDDGQLRVLKAGAGVGKTTVSRTLVHELAHDASRTKTIPIYVEAQHWKNQLHDNSRFYDVISNSMVLLSAGLVPEDIFYHALREGYLSFIFDGFDELCSREYDPIEVLDQLSKICRESKARILLTTRSGFWEVRVESVGGTANIPVITLEPFNTQQARGYFRKAFGPGTEKQKAAEKLHKLLREHTVPLDHTGSVRDEMFNLPFCVRVLADYVKDGEHPSGLGEMTFYGLLLAICKREQTRQLLETPAEDQIESFIDVAVADGTERPCFALRDLLSLPAGGFRMGDEGKIREHALIRGDRDEFCFKYDFLAPYLRALGVRDALRRERLQLQKGLIEVLERERDGVGDVSENLNRILQQSDFEAVVRGCHRSIADRDIDLASFFFHLGLKLSRRNRNISSDAERTEALFWPSGYRGSRMLVGWSFFGTVEELDLTDVTFKSCTFRGTKFRRCRVNSGTVFDDCTFVGSIVLPLQWQVVDYRDNCEAPFPADVVWEKILRRKIGKRTERVEVLLDIALGKFWHGGRFRASIEEANWHRGWLGESREKNRVLDAMLKAGLISRIPISGVTGGGYAFDRGALADLQNYMDGRQKSGKVRVVFEDLVG